ncbi:MAG: sensor N-terminal transmembrane domain-containing protein [Novosphingobium sp.]|nr:sensor N-terminal transmembrane domain-containing protein [Novosphingobium sp.]
MAPAIPLPNPEAVARTVGGRLFWTRRTSLTARILAVNIFAVALLAGSLFYLDSYRNQLLAARFKQASSEAEIVADALRSAGPAQRRSVLAAIGKAQRLRLRLYSPKGRLLADSFALAPPSFQFRDPTRQPWLEHAAQELDKGMDALFGAPSVPPYRERTGTSADFPEIAEARDNDRSVVVQRYAADRTPVITAATPVGEDGLILLSLRNAPDITQSVRDARQTLAIIVAIALLFSILLSLFLARTIVQPLRALVRAAVRVRLGRDREVVVPRLPERRDEIGLLARAFSDMTTALRQRIDAVESFAADVAHEIKNPLASLRSALESLEKVEDPELRHRLTAIAAHDVRRIDRLVTEIADASRIDAELSRTAFEPVDLPALIEAVVHGREQRGANRDCPIEVRREGHGACRVAGDPARLERVLENLLDNAVSFSPPRSPIEVAVCEYDGLVEADVSDHGPGIAPDAREKVFERFHSLRPADEDFGSHSGLGLAIARTIVEAHDGTLAVHDRSDGTAGARLVITLPALGE